MSEEETTPSVMKAGAAALWASLATGIQITGNVLPPTSPLLPNQHRSVTDSHLRVDAEASTVEEAERARMEAPLGPQDQLEEAVEQGEDWVEKRLEDNLLESKRELEAPETFENSLELHGDEGEVSPDTLAHEPDESERFEVEEFDDLAETEFDDLAETEFDDLGESEFDDLGDTEARDSEGSEMGSMLG